MKVLKSQRNTETHMKNECLVIIECNMENTNYELLAKLAVKKGLMTLDQLKLCLREFEALDTEAKAGYSLLDIVINNGFATKIQLDNLEISAEKSLLAELSSSPIEHQIIDGYEIKEKIGSGAMGVVYRAWHKAIGRDVALKILPPKLAKDDEYKERFLREARAAAKLNHQNIVSAYDVGMSNGLYYFAMEFVEGKSVMQMIKDKGLLDEKFSMNIVKQITQGLKLVWKQKIVHRDVKPENILVDKDGIAKLCDLGLAKQIDADPQLTASGAAVGTPFYISPEQAKGKQEIDIRSDIYSLGATLFHMVIGRPPFEGTSAAVIMTKHINQPLPEPCVLRSDLSPDVGYFIKKMMAKSCEMRYQDPLELLEDIDRYDNGKPLKAKAKTASLKIPRKIQSLQTGYSKQNIRQTPVFETLESLSDRSKLAPTARISRKQQQRILPMQSHKKSKNLWTLISVVLSALVLFTIVLVYFVNYNNLKTPEEIDKKSQDNTGKVEEKPVVVKIDDKKDKTNQDEDEIKLENLRKDILKKLSEADEKVFILKFADAFAIYDEIINSDSNNEKLPELVKDATERKKQALLKAEELAKKEISRIKSLIVEKNYENDEIGQFFNKILELWSDFNQNLLFTKTYIELVAGEDGIIKIILQQANDYFDKVTKNVDIEIKEKNFEKAKTIVQQAKSRLPDEYENSIYELLNVINDQIAKEKKTQESIIIEKKKNAPKYYDAWVINLRKYLVDMHINKALEDCENSLKDDNFILDEKILNNLNNDLSMLKLIQTTYDNIYSLIYENGISGKTIKIEFDEFKNNTKYINIANIENLNDVSTIIPKIDFTFDYFSSIDPKKEGKSKKLIFSLIPAIIADMLLRFAMQPSNDPVKTNSADELNEKKLTLVTFYTLNLPNFPNPKDGDIEDALIRIIKIINKAKASKIILNLHPIISMIFKSRFEVRVSVDFASITDNFKLWERKIKSKQKHVLGEKLIESINFTLTYFSDSEFLSENDNENEKQLRKWLAELIKTTNENREIQLFYGNYKLKDNKIEIEYDFSNKEQLLDFTIGDTNNRGVFAWDKTKKALMMSAKPYFGRDGSTVAALKWLAKFCEKEFDIKIEYEVPYALFYSISLYKTDENQYSIPLRARMLWRQNLIQIKHALYAGAINLLETDKNKPYGEPIDEMAPDTGSFNYRIKRDRKGFFYSYINNKLVYKVKEESLTKGFLEFNAIFSRFYIKKLKIECELDKDWLKAWEMTLKEGKDPRKDFSSESYDSDEDFKKGFDWMRGRNGDR